jgi:hypothetical protein
MNAESLNQQDYRTKAHLCKLHDYTVEAFCTLETLLMMPSTSKYGNTISIVWSASKATVKETSHSLIVNELTERHRLSPNFRTVSLMSSIAQKAAVQILFKSLPSFRKR